MSQAGPGGRLISSKIIRCGPQRDSSSRQDKTQYYRSEHAAKNPALGASPPDVRSIDGGGNGLHQCTSGGDLSELMLKISYAKHPLRCRESNGPGPSTRLQHYMEHRD